MVRNRIAGALALWAVAATFAAGQAIEHLPPFSVTAARTSRPSAESATLTREFRGEALRHRLAVDHALRADPAFSLFRRTDSLAAHPTAQGVSLRGIGPSGASRSLVLLDGVPLNDPFGGWVAWNQIPTVALAAVEIARGGGAGTWGNAALGGTIALVSSPTARSGGVAVIEAGARETLRAELSAGAQTGLTAVRLDARTFTTGGYHPLRPGDRGRIDVPLATEHRARQLRAYRQLGDVAATLTLRDFDDEHTNGTDGQSNATRIRFASVALRPAGDPARDWQLSLYAQRQAFRSTFTSAALDRAAETPANDQFAVPATAAGAALTLEWREGERRTTAGADVRHVRGETREDFLFSGGALARRRFAGGAQTLGGVFVAHDRPVGEKWRGTASFRADGWQLADGRRREVERATGAVLRDERFADHRRATWSGTAGIVWTPRPGWRGRAAAYRSFRVPTLNELYRPFRVGNVNTEANPALRHETLLGAEIGGDHQRGGLAFSVTGFAHRLENAVGNVTLATTPTLVSRQRRNLDCIEVRGAEARATWQAQARLAVEAAWLWSDAEVIRATGQPNLVGRRLPQVPHHVATAALHWEFIPSWTLLAQARWSDRQFEDDDNTLALGAAGGLDLQVSKRLTEHSTVTVAVENATDTAVPVARSANGLTSYAAPRTWRASWRLTW